MTSHPRRERSTYLWHPIHKCVYCRVVRFGRVYLGCSKQVKLFQNSPQYSAHTPINELATQLKEVENYCRVLWKNKRRVIYGRSQAESVFLPSNFRLFFLTKLNFFFIFYCQWSDIFSIFQRFNCTAQKNIFFFDLKSKSLTSEFII